ncbi:hypothetical protein DIPPA_25167 [Diplonema papillatum]|nr:hypothetical protein DIPPA_25167 [Diplonema papillatum]
MGGTQGIPLEVQKLTSGLHTEKYERKWRPGKPSDVHDRCCMNYGRKEDGYLYPESLDPNDYNANSLRTDKQLTHHYPARHVQILPGQPHYSKLKYECDLRDDSTGYPLYYGMRPWRCHDRLTDSFLALWYLRRPYFGRVFTCAFSEVGKEPDMPYQAMSRHDVEFYVDRISRGNLRMRMFEKYPFECAFDPIPVPSQDPVVLDPIE